MKTANTSKKQSAQPVFDVVYKIKNKSDRDYAFARDNASNDTLVARGIQARSAKLAEKRVVKEQSALGLGNRTVKVLKVIRQA